jgi:hypothetical protein
MSTTESHSFSDWWATLTQDRRDRYWPHMDGVKLVWRDRESELTTLREQAKELAEALSKLRNEITAIRELAGPAIIGQVGPTNYAVLVERISGAEAALLKYRESKR